MNLLYNISDDINTPDFKVCTAFVNTSSNVSAMEKEYLEVPVIGRVSAGLPILAEENLDALKKGAVNLEAHIDTLTKFGLPVVVAINRFGTDTDAELDVIREICEKKGVDFALSEVFAKGGEGGQALAEEVIRLTEESNDDFSFSYELEGSIEDKLNQIVQKIYGGKRVVLTADAKKQAKELENLINEKYEDAFKYFDGIFNSPSTNYNNIADNYLYLLNNITLKGL